MWRVGTVRAELKSLYSPDALSAPDLSMWQPTDPSNFAIYLQAFIGPGVDEASDSFDVLLCTPRWLGDNWDHPGVGKYGLSAQVKSGRGLVLMQRWDYSELDDAIRRLCSTMIGKTWADVADRIGRHLPWEFDSRFDEEQDKRRSP